MSKVVYDEKVDALYIDIAKGKVEESVEIGGNVIVDLDRNARIVGIELLNVNAIFGETLAQKVLASHRKPAAKRG
jgi:uncharacterized protein YuzE